MSQTHWNRDPILDEIHQTRQRMSEKFGGDISAILEDARLRQAASGRAVWQSPEHQPVLQANGATETLKPPGL